VADTHRFGFFVPWKCGCVGGEPTKQRSIVEGEALAAELRMMNPEENQEVKGFIKIRDGDGKRNESPVPLSNRSRGQELAKHYETQPAGGAARRN